MVLRDDATFNMLVLLACYLVPLAINLPIGVLGLRDVYKKEGAIKDEHVIITMCLTWIPGINILGTLVSIGGLVYEVYSWAAKVGLPKEKPIKENWNE